MTKFTSGVCQGYALAPDSFATGMDWSLERTVGTGINAASSADLDFAKDVALLAELLEFLVAALETMASQAASLALRKLLGIKWYHHMQNDEVRQTTG